MDKKSKKNLFILCGKSRSGKDYLLDMLRQNTQETIMRLSGGDLVKEVARKNHGYQDGKSDDDRSLLNYISNAYRYNKQKVFDDMVFKMFLTDDEFMEYNETESFWAYVLMRKLYAAPEEIKTAFITDLRFFGEYRSYMKHVNEFNITFVRLVNSGEYSRSDNEVNAIWAKALARDIRCFTLLNEYDKKFDQQVYNMWNIHTHLPYISRVHLFELMEKFSFYDGDNDQAISDYNAAIMYLANKNIKNISDPSITVDDFLDRLVFVLVMKNISIYKQQQLSGPMSSMGKIYNNEIADAATYVIDMYSENIASQHDTINLRNIS